MNINSRYQPMPQNKNNNVHFQGTVGKSVTNYLKQVQKDVIKTKGEGKIENVNYTKNTILVIKERLTSFMSKTAPDTKLELKQIDDFNYAPYFKNKKTEVEAWSNSNQNIQVNVPRIKLPRYNAQTLWANITNKRYPHQASDLDGLDKYSQDLVEKVKPEYVDKLLENAKTAVKPTQTTNDNGMDKAIKELKDLKI